MSTATKFKPKGCRVGIDCAHAATITVFISQSPIGALANRQASSPLQELLPTFALS
jgi:hypothetical protein